MGIWKPLVGECLQCVKEPANEVGNNAVAMVRNWKSLQLFIFMDLKSPLNWLKNKIAKIVESLNETVKHCLN